ncbi:uncharacterized [Tachysurus ichikawai]
MSAVPRLLRDLLWEFRMWIRVKAHERESKSHVNRRRQQCDVFVIQQGRAEDVSHLESAFVSSSGAAGLSGFNLKADSLSPFTHSLFLFVK